MNIKKILREELYRQYNIDNIIKRNLYENLNRLILNESLSSVVYHFTDREGLFGILNTNQIKLTKTTEDFSEKNKKAWETYNKFHNPYDDGTLFGGPTIYQPNIQIEKNFDKNYNYHLSLTRNKYGLFPKLYENKQNIRICFDGNKLSNTFKGVPVNYNYMNKRTDSSNSNNFGIDLEEEDRLLSNKPVINNCINYIIRIDILDISDLARDVKKTANEDFSKKIFVYRNLNDYKLENNNCYNLFDGNENNVKDRQDNNANNNDSTYDFDFYKANDINGIPIEVGSKNGLRLVNRVIGNNVKYNIYNPFTKKILSDIWFDACGDFYNSMSTVELNGKYNLMDVNGKLYLKTWAENERLSLNDDGTYIAEIDGKYNLYRLNGQKIFNNDFEEILFHDNHSSGVRINGKVYIIDDRGNKLIDDSFDNAEYYKPMYTVTKGDKSTYLNRNCEYITNMWFDECRLFGYDYPKHGYVKLNNKWNIISGNGDILCDIWFDWINEFIQDNALYDYAVVGLNEKMNYIDRKGNIISNHWFDKGCAIITEEGYFNVEDLFNKLFNSWSHYRLYPDGRLFIRLTPNGEEKYIEVENTKDFDPKNWFMNYINKQQDISK